MTTPDPRDYDPDGEVPVSADDLARLATQIYSQLTPLQVQVPEPAPATAPVAPRGSLPDTTAPASAVQSTFGSTASATPFGVESGRAFPDFSVIPHAVGQDTPPGQVPVAPRGETVGTSASAAPFDLAATELDIAPGSLAPLARYATEPPSGDTQTAPPPPGRTEVPTQATDPFGWVPPSDALTSPTPASATPEGLSDRSEVFDVATIRADFPILSERVNGHPLIWFDNAATTQKPQAVIDRLAHFYAHENSNIHRAAHELAARATDAYEDARESIRRFLGASRVEEIVFVRGTTEGINLIAHSWGPANLGPGDEIVISHLEHHANVVPWQIVAQRTGAVIKVAPVDDAGNLLLEEFTRLVGPRTKLVAVTQVSNALGTVTPVHEIAQIARRAGARVLVDGAQSVPHLAVDLQTLDADFFVFSGHKIFGPTGIGAVFIAERVWDETPAWQGGGNMIADVTVERSIYQPPPHKYEAGTGNIADAVGLGEAIRYVERIGLTRIETYEHDLLAYATPRLAEIDGVRLVGTAERKASVLSFVLAGHDPVAVGTALNERGIAVRAGHHCAQPILRRLGLEATVRPSFAFYNTYDEIDVFLDAVRDIAHGSR